MLPSQGQCCFSLPKSTHSLVSCHRFAVPGIRGIFLMQTQCYLITRALRALQREESNENISPLRARRFSNWDKKRVVLGQSQAEGISGQGRSFSPLKSLQNPIGKAELHH